MWYGWNIWIVLLVLSMLMIERGITDCDQRLTRTCFAKRSIADRAISIFSYLATGATITYQVLDTESLECAYFTIYDLQTFISGNRCYKIKSCCPVPLYIQILSWLKFMVAFGDVDNCENFMSHQEGMVIAKKVTQQGSRNNRIHWFGFNPCGEY